MTSWYTPTEGAGQLADQTSLYYDELDHPQQLLRENRLVDAVAASLRNLSRIPSVVVATKQEYGKFDLGSLPPIETICQIAPALCDESAIDACAEMVEAVPELAPWSTHVEQARQDAKFARTLTSYIGENPGCIQSKIGKALGYDGRRVASILYWMARAGLVLRVRAGSSYQLRLPYRPAPDTEVP